jgi:drug/metabolite transporter (DMT)-like permease
VTVESELAIQRDTLPSTTVVTDTSGRGWLAFAIVTTVTWGVWGALIEIPEQAGFPATLGYSIWALTMIPCAAAALRRVNWKIETGRRPATLAAAVGLLGAGGQLILFQALRDGPAYVVFPVVSLYPAITVALSVVWLRERARPRHWAGILLALPAVLLLSYAQPVATPVTGYGWLFLVIAVLLMWGVQGLVMKLSNEAMSAESVFAYMTITGLVLVPLAIFMTDFTVPVNWGLKGPYLAAAIHVLNSIGALCLVYAVRYGKAMIVVPLTSLAPVLTIILSLAIYQRFPPDVQIVGMTCALIAIYLLAT